MSSSFFSGFWDETWPFDSLFVDPWNNPNYGWNRNQRLEGPKREFGSDRDRQLYQRGQRETEPTSSGSSEISRWRPFLDVREGDKELFLYCELPGVKKEDVNIELNDDLLTISGERKEEKKEDSDKYHFRESRFGHFRRSLRLPKNMQLDDIKANFRDGILEVRVPKGAECMNRKKICIGEQPRLTEKAGEKTFDKPEKTFEKTEKTFDKPEKTFDKPEKTFEKTEKTEKTFDKPEKTFDKPEKPFDKPEKPFEKTGGKKKKEFKESKDTGFDKTGKQKETFQQPAAEQYNAMA